MPVDRDRLVRVSSRLRAGPRIVREHQGAVAVLVALALAVAAVVAARSLELEADQLGWGLVALATLVGVPLTALANGLEHRAVGASVGVRIPLGAALRTTITATAANLLPLPGGIVVRTEDLTHRGARLRDVGRVTLLAAATWASLGATLAAVGLALASAPVAAATAGALAAGATVVAVALGLTRTSTATPELLAAEALAVGASALRVLLLLAALDHGWDLPRALVLSASGIVSQTVGFLPAGIGLREAASAGLAAAVALPAAVGLLVAVLDRVIGLGVHALLGLVVWRLGRREEPVT